MILLYSTCMLTTKTLGCLIVLGKPTREPFTPPLLLWSITVIVPGMNSLETSTAAITIRHAFTEERDGLIYI
jgi:hypothetical protein